MLIFHLIREEATEIDGHTLPYLQNPSGHPFNSVTQGDKSIFKQTRDQSLIRQELLFIHRFTEYIELRGISFVNSIYEKRAKDIFSLKMHPL